MMLATSCGSFGDLGGSGESGGESGGNEGEDCEKYFEFSLKDVIKAWNDL